MKPLQDILWVPDAGHDEDTYGKRSPGNGAPPGVMEFEFNRAIMGRVVDLAAEYGMRTKPTTVGPWPVKLERRTELANTWAQQHRGPSRFLSIHANAGGPGGWYRARGAVVFTSKNASKDSGILAKRISQKLQTVMPLPWYSRGVKKTNYEVLKGTTMPAVLVECGFMTSLADCYMLASEYGRDCIARAIVEAMYEIQYGVIVRAA